MQLDGERGATPIVRGSYLATITELTIATYPHKLVLRQDLNGTIWAAIAEGKQGGSQ